MPLTKPPFNQFDDPTTRLRDLKNDRDSCSNSVCEFSQIPHWLPCRKEKKDRQLYKKKEKEEEEQYEQEKQQQKEKRKREKESMRSYDDWMKKKVNMPGCASDDEMSRSFCLMMTQCMLSVICQPTILASSIEFAGEAGLQTVARGTTAEVPGGARTCDAAPAVEPRRQNHPRRPVADTLVRHLPTGFSTFRFSAGRPVVCESNDQNALGTRFIRP